MRSIDIRQATAVTPDEARDNLAALFPDATEYGLAQPGRVPIAVRFSSPPIAAADPLTLWRTLFPEDGRYVVADVGELGLLLKARPTPRGTPFEEWFLERLMVEATKQFRSTREVVLRVILRFIREHGGSLTDPHALQAFEHQLFDLRQAIRWSLAQPVNPAVQDVAHHLGFTDQDRFDLGGIAYRLGKLDTALREAGRRWSWAVVLQKIAEVPLLPADEAAIAYARARAGQYLTPVLLRDGQALMEGALEREQAMLREMTVGAIREEMHPTAFARQLYKRLDPEGVQRDFDRVARTEIMEARLQGAFEAERARHHWTASTLIYRQVNANPCKACLRLFKLPDGRPRLYRVRDVEAADALGYNRGPWRDWRPKIGPVHPACRCFPWAAWNPALGDFYARDAERWRPLIDHLHVHDDQEEAA